MATENIKVGVDISDNGSSKKLQTNIESVHKAVTSLQKAAANVNMGGTAGSRAVYAKADPGAVTQYGQQRGAAGATGASARDFANQAQGLGGLVRLYATYAANVFAVGAAFRALSSAMDTTNMIRGLDQLGAQSGMALGSLSKRLAAASDGAVSLREAMEATAKASSSGMSSESILRMGKVAKQASQALGVDMADALSRITRGVTKLEPELLDELGIFTKVGKATEDYAKSVGKSASALTDFERRMAFTNAVLAEGEKKFGAIKIDTNPYSQLAASVQNISQNILELVNAGLGPLIKLLASSPTALAAAIGVIGTTIVKQAIPAISDYRANLAKMADSAKDAAQRRLKDLKFAQTAEYRETVAHYDRTAQLAAASFVRTSDALVVAQAAISKDKNVSKGAKEIAGKALSEIDEKDLDYLDKLAAKNSRLSPIYASLAKAVREYDAAEVNFTQAKKAQNIVLEKSSSMWTNLGQNEQRYHNEVNDARKRSMTSQAALVGSTNGLFAGLKSVGQAYRESRKDIQTVIPLNDALGTTITTTTKGLSAIPAALNLVKNGLVTTAAAVGTAVAAFMPWLEIIGLVVAAGGAFISWMSNTKDESAATSASLDALKESGKGLYNTLDAIAQKPFLEQVSVTSLAAKATAVADMSQQMSKSVKDSFAEIDKMGTTDKVTNWFSKLWNGDVESKLTDSISRGLFRSFQAIDKSSAAGKEADAAIKRILKVDNVDSSLEIDKALSSMSSGERRVALDLIAKAMSNVSLSMQVSAAKGTELVDAFNKIKESKQKLTTEFNAKDSLATYGSDLIASFFKLDVALADPTQKLNAIKELTKNITEIPGVSSALLASLASLDKNVANLQSVNAEIGNLDNQINAATKQLAKFDGYLKVLSQNKQVVDPNTQAQLNEINSVISSLTTKKNQKISLQLELSTKINEAQENVKTAQLKVFTAGADIISSKLSGEWAKAGNIIATTIGGILGNTEAGIKMRADAEKQMLAVQAEELKLRRSLIIATENNTLANDKNSLALDKASFAALGTDIRGTARDKVLADLSKREEGISYRESVIGGKGKTFGQVSKDVAAGVSGASQEALATAQALESTAAALANVKAQINQSSIKAADEFVRLRFQKEGESLTTQTALLTVEKERFNALKEVSSETNLQALLTKQSIEAKERSLKRDQDLLAINTELARIEKLRSDASVTYQQKQKIGEAIPELEKKKYDIERVAFAKELSAVSQNQLDVENTRYKQSVQSSTDIYTINQRTLETKLQTNDTEQKLLDANKTAGRYSEESYINEKASLEAKKLQLELESKISQAKREQATGLAGIANEENLIKINAQNRYNTEVATLASQGQFAQIAGVRLTQTDAEKAKLIELQDARNRITATYTDAETKANALAEADKKVLDIIKASNLEQAKWNESLSIANDLSNNLASAFGKVGEAIGGSVSAMLEIAKAQETYNKAIKDSPEQKKKAEEDLKNAQLTGITKIISANKKMFDEKSKGYKIMTSLEQGFTALTALNNLSRLKDTIESSYQAVVAMSPAIMAQFLKWLGPWGFAAGAAAIAAIGGRSPSKPGFVMSSEQMQETQGTGSTYVQSSADSSEGVLVATGKGVFGDIRAKSASIANTLTLIKENQVDGLAQDSKMLKALQALDLSILEVAKALPNFQTNISGVAEGSTSKSSLFGILGTTTTTTEVTNAGLELKGTFWDLVKSANGLVKVFTDVKTTTTDSGLFGTGLFADDPTTTISRMFPQFAQLNQKQLTAVTDMFRKGAVAIGTIGGKLGTTVDQAISAMKAVQVGGTIDLKGKTQEEVATELQNMMSSYLDDVTTRLYPSIVSTFREIGEGAYQTVSRVLDTNEKIAQAISNLKLSTPNLTGVYDVTEALTKAAGGLDKFISQANFFSENFLTEAERLAPKQTLVTKKMAELGKSSVTTIAGFKELVKGLDLTKEADAALYQSLMDLAPAFYDVAKAAESSIQATIDKFKDFAKTLREFRDSLILGTQSTLTPQQKYAEARRQFDQVYALALGGDKDAQGKLTSVSSAFLEASKTYNASSAQYTVDFNDVLGKINSGIISAEAQMTTAEKQLSEAQTQSTILASIDTATATTADLLNQAMNGASAGTVTASATSANVLARPTTSVASTTTTSSYKGATLTDNQIAFFDFLDSAEGAFFKDLRGQALSNAIGSAVPSLVGGGLVGSLALRGVMQAAGAFNPNALSVSEADALAQVAMDSPSFQQAIKDAVAAGVSQDKLGDIMVSIRETMKREAEGTSFLGDLLGTGNGNKDAAARTIEYAIDQLKVTTSVAEQATRDAIEAARRAEAASAINDEDYYQPSSYRFGIEGGVTGDFYSPQQSYEISGIATAATGGYVSGPTIVGELGPELVDFQTPGRVYTAQETFGMFNGGNANQALIREIQQLRKEVVTLQRQQAEQTGHLINAAYDSQNQNAEQVAEAVTSTAATQQWAAKLQASAQLV